MAALIGALRVSLSADTAAFHKGMQGAERRAKTSGNAIAKSLGVIKAGFAGLAAGLTVGLFVNLAKQALDYAGSLGEISQQLGVTTRDLQTFRYAAGQLGVSQSELETGLSKLTITLGKIATGAKAPTAALNALGISAKQVAGLDTGDAFRLIADGLEKIPDRAERAAVEVALFGRAGAQLDTMLSGGSKALNELAQAAETLGIVLSDEQIQRADDTADKLEAVKTVLMSRIAGVVADNASSIVKLADSLAYLITQAGEAAAKMTAFYRSIAIGAARFAAANPTLAKVAFGTKGTAKILRAGQGAILGNIADRKTPTIAAKLPRSASVLPDFNAGGGGGGKARKGPKDTTARDTFQFEQDLRRTQIDILRAQQDLATDYVERHRIALDILKLERAAYEHELAYAVASGDITKTRADQLLAEDAKLLALKQDKVLQDEEFERRREFNDLAQVDLDIQKEGLEAQAQLAETASERRDIELRILDLQVRQERARLEAVIADEQSGHLAQEEARRRLAVLDKIAASDRQGVINSTRGPLESYLASLPSDAAKMNEALEHVAANGLQSLEDGLVAIADGTKTVGEAFREMAASIIADLIRIQIQKMIVGLISSISGGVGGIGLPAGGFASGGFTGNIGRNRIAGMVHGNEFVLNAEATRRLGVPNLNALNSGAPVSAVSNDNSIGGSRGEVHIHMSGPMTDRQARQTGMQAAQGYKQETARAAKVIG